MTLAALRLRLSNVRREPRQSEQVLARWRPVVLSALLLADGAACRKQQVVSRLHPIEEKFVVGVEPRYCAPALLGEAPRCCTKFTASDVIAIEAVDGGPPRPRIVREGSSSSW